MAEGYKELNTVSTMESGSKANGSTSIEMSSHPAQAVSPPLSDSDPVLQDLLKAVKERDISKLKARLPERHQQKIRYVNHKYDADDVRGSLLHVAAKKGDEWAEIAKLLIASGANPNARDLQVGKYCPIHYAAERQHPQMMRILLEEKANPNAREAGYGRRPLHLILTKWKQKEKQFKECLDILLENFEQLNLDCKSDKQSTPLYLALDQKCDYMVNKMIEYGANLENELIKSKFPNYIPKVSVNESIKSKQKSRHFGDELLEELLKANDLLKFQNILSDIDNFGESNSAIINEDYGKTLLQYACDRGHTDFAVELLKNDADLTKEDTATLYTPLLYASRKGYHQIMELLIDSMKNNKQVEIEKELKKADNKGETALHKIVKQEYRFDEEGRDFEKCFNILMNNLEYISIDQQDHLGFTALHHAVQLEDPNFVRQLLSSGAHWGIENKRENVPIRNINPELLEELLDSCICFKPQDSNKEQVPEDFEIDLKYHMLIPSKSRNSETERLMSLSKLQSHQFLLCHPIIDTFLHLKWQKIRPWYYVNIATYSIYLLCLTAYSLIFYGNFSECDSSSTNSTDSYNTSSNFENSSALNSEELGN